MSNVEIEAHSTAVEVLDELTEDEERERHRLELRVERAFFLAGAALRQLRDRRLYRDTHPDDFIGYCRDRFGKTKQAVNYLIAAAGVYENLTTTNSCRDDNDQTTTIRCRVLPSSEYQVRSLAGLEPEKQQEIWLQAVDEADGKAPSGRIVRGIVKRLKEKPLFKATDFCQVGDVFTLIRLEGPERKYNTCWAITSEVKNLV